MNDTWFNISDTSVKQLQERKLSCASTDFSAPYILVYKKIMDEIACISNNITLSDHMNRLAVLREFNIQKQKTASKSIVSDTNTNHENQISLKSPIKRKRQFSNLSSEKRVKKFRANLDDLTKKNINNKHKQDQCANLDDDTRKNITKESVKKCCDNLDDLTKKNINNKHK